LASHIFGTNDAIAMVDPGEICLPLPVPEINTPARLGIAGLMHTSPTAFSAFATTKAEFSVYINFKDERWSREAVSDGRN
jgi:hypothetical protein